MRGGRRADVDGAVGDLDVNVAGIEAANALYARGAVKATFKSKLQSLFGATAAPMPDRKSVV